MSDARQNEQRKNRRPASTKRINRQIGDVRYQIELVPNRLAYDLILTRHYAKRLPSISFCFGLFREGDLVGVITYGTPPSSTLCRGVCGDEYQSIVLELNRLVLRDNLKNEASLLIGASLTLLPSPTIVVSFADSAQSHLGKVYQATNFFYTGQSARFRDLYVKGFEHQHHASFGHGQTVAQLKARYGEENVYWKERSRKHRYVYLVGTKKERQMLESLLRYPVVEYPKGEADETS